MFYLIGIGGAGMSVVAELLQQEGYQVSGSDGVESEVTHYLQSVGIPVYIGHSADHVPADAVVVVSSAIRDSNPELAVARSRGQRIVHRSQALALAAAGKDFVAVAGAHGKTTTSAMIALTLQELGRDPSWAIGGTLAGGGAGGHLGSGSIFVAEADESDASFLNYTPRIAVVTNVEPDHLDHYGTREAFEEAFLEFSRNVSAGGLLIVCGDDDGAARLGMAALAEGRRVASYGRGEPVRGVERHVRIVDECHEYGCASGTFEDITGNYPVSLRIVGAHQLLNAAGAWLAGVELGADGTKFAASLHKFRGTQRRFESRGEAGGVRVIDDYAHHPTEVAATLRAAREFAGEGRVLVLFQPHLYSRTRNFAAQFAKALSAADEVIVTSVYPAREDPIPGVEGDVITEHMGGAHARYVADKHEAARQIAHAAVPGDVVLTMGAGNVTELGPEIVQELSKR
ncbi:MAG: UDP-N-acetylmuramate--L-alanine ligase [Ancrocorticia sp.]|jgi:UDP-N-acetylmuramate--alanine ligase|nr:UDP-N-acetylmuramate--L-alanine ligase [Ancrocorticia sp.]MCI1895329.1 UDP-N-acetylmuramate--L-alanine ligase [Ancrocorticia sp.]MCI1932064.1 UDP-N-acetylmuramate--L-alanine ligase [Ancrocorticia sp.]MCI2028824.1 UDP-N-acetylmuramate--L-alanine ligase [Ancrocorticia sp.]MCI2177700.1 UDP-N-acetylmuramate--L-alanine ligase [Ancrocorticia sp.]